MHRLALRYETGDGVPQDWSQAVHWHRLAAGRGYAAAMSSLAWCLEQGKGADRSPEQAARWYQKGAEAGDRRAMVHWAQCCQEGSGTIQNLEEAVRWYRSAAEAGDGAAMYCLGRCYETGSGVKADEKEAQHWYYKGMKAGDRQAMLAFLGDGPEETAQLDAGELENLREAARSGDVDAMYRMGLHCEEGTGTRPDPEQALHWYRQAAAGGHIPAPVPYGAVLRPGDRRGQRHEARRRRSIRRPPSGGTRTPWSVWPGAMSTERGSRRIKRRPPSGTSGEPRPRRPRKTGGAAPRPVDRTAPVRYNMLRETHKEAATLR